MKKSSSENNTSLCSPENGSDVVPSRKMAFLRRQYAPLTIILAILLIVYWTSLFVATHVPIPKGMLRNGGDKVAHFLTYGFLSALMMAVRASQGSFGWKSVMARFFLIIGYGAFDELTQLLVRRHADLIDWSADVVGTAAGIAGFIIAKQLFDRIRPSEQTPQHAGDPVTE